MSKLDYQHPHSATWRTSKLLWIGLVILVLGSGPLIVEHLYDSSINDIGRACWRDVPSGLRSG